MTTETGGKENTARGAGPGRSKVSQGGPQPVGRASPNARLSLLLLWASQRGLEHNPARRGVGAKGIAQGSGIPVGSLHSQGLSHGESLAQGGNLHLERRGAQPIPSRAISEFSPNFKESREYRPSSFDFTSLSLPATMRKCHTPAVAKRAP